ncbi:MAG: PaaI family thioesterase [Candidatus Poribacteria bacterium]
MQVEDNNRCFACGKENPIGLRLDIQTVTVEHPNEDRPRAKRSDGEDLLVRTECTPPEHFQGWANVIHGGVLSALLDEVITYVAIAHFGGPAMTAQLDIRFKQPAPVGSKLLVTSRPINRSRRLVQAIAKIQLEDGTVIAEATGKCLKAKDLPEAKGFDS